MSRIYFHTPDNDAEVYGAERAHFANLLNRLALGILDVTGFDARDKFLGLVDISSYLHQSSSGNFGRQFEVAFSTGLSLRFDGKAINTFDIALNTAFAIGNDPIKLAARIHGQCEIHCYIKPENTLWIAEIIQAGLTKKIYRQDMGWDSVIELLHRNQPTVLSYSVTDQFPNAYLAGYKTEKEREAFWELSDAERWEKAYSELVKNDGLEITPETWEDFYFTDGITAFDVLDYLERVK